MKVRQTALLRDLWDSERVWYWIEEYFWKKGSTARTVWHQDTSYYPLVGDHWANLWISFDAVPRSHGLEVVRGSYRETLYDGSRGDASNPTLPLWGDKGDLPRLPDIEKERITDPESWDIISYGVEPGDVIVLHPGSLHGGGPTDAAFSHRETLLLRFFGNDAVWGKLPEDKSATGDAAKVVPEGRRGRPGEPFRDSRSFQLC